jgi:hypothetical protein
VSTVPPIRREILVDADPAAAFEGTVTRWEPPAPGEGMTILRLPGPGRLAEAARLATEDDASVAGGFFAVTVRPWQVMMAAG